MPIGQGTGYRPGEKLKGWFETAIRARAVQEREDEWKVRNALASQELRMRFDASERAEKKFKWDQEKWEEEKIAEEIKQKQARAKLLLDIEKTKLQALDMQGSALKTAVSASQEGRLTKKDAHVKEEDRRDNVYRDRTQSLKEREQGLAETKYFNEPAKESLKTESEENLAVLRNRLSEAEDVPWWKPFSSPADPALVKQLQEAVNRMEKRAGEGVKPAVIPRSEISARIKAMQKESLGEYGGAPGYPVKKGAAMDEATRQRIWQKARGNKDLAIRIAIEMGYNPYQ